MSRFSLGKSVIPISIMKEKENKAATATRSASCSIGKWGTVAFTSTRYSSLQAQQSIIAQTNEDIKKDTSFDRERSVSPPAEPVKPKKFFKSRNNTQARVIIIPASSDVSSSTLETTNSTTTVKQATNTHQNYFHENNKRSEEVVSVKQRVNSSNSSAVTKKVKKEREKQIKEPKEQIVEQEEKIQTPKGTRTSARNKKIVNYNLEEESIYCRSREKEKEKDSKKEISSSTNEIITPTTSAPPQNEANVDHPPIVLRISKVRSSYDKLFILLRFICLVATFDERV
ncbi:WAPAL.2 family protein [Megaselia abdita]